MSLVGVTFEVRLRLVEFSMSNVSVLFECSSKYVEVWFESRCEISSSLVSVWFEVSLSLL